MADDRTKVTELATALGLTGHRTLREAIEARPAVLEISSDEWDDLDRILASRKLIAVAGSAFANGAYYAAHTDGLDGRIPQHIEWSGGRRIPGDRPVPADLLIDRVYMISCKYLSKILHNTAPAHVFLDALVAAPESRGINWFQHVAPTAHEALYVRTVEVLGLSDMAESPEVLDSEHRRKLKAALKKRTISGLPDELDPQYKALIGDVSRRSAELWRQALGDRAEQERMLWRLLRIYSATYFILGIDQRRTMRLRVMTPWEWRQSYQFVSLAVRAAGRGQPRVDWDATYRDLAAGQRHHVRGHIEIRWSHRPFCGPPEAKVYLDIPHEQVPGYRQLDHTDEPPPYDQQSLIDCP
ncbi:MAG: hypothetical protein F4Z78_08590 [Gammaproteobacteria bacterium]|nr:hypothetical protein [Gammaproteobacteria bacterium]